MNKIINQLIKEEENLPDLIEKIKNILLIETGNHIPNFIIKNYIKERINNES